MFDTFKKIYALLDPVERKKSMGLLFLIAIMGLFETLGAASIMPFIAVLSDPTIIERQPLLTQLITFIGLDSSQHLMVLTFLGISFLALLLIGNSLKLLTAWATFKFTEKCSHRLSTQLLTKYLNENYAYFLNKNTSKMTKNVLSESRSVAGNAILPLLRIIAQVAITFFLLSLLFMINPGLTSLMSLFFILSYVLTYSYTKGRLQRLGQIQLQKNSERYKIISEAFYSIKDIKIFGCETFTIDRFIPPSKTFASVKAKHEFIGEFPRHVMEVIAFGGIILLCLYLIQSHQSISQSLPMISLYAIAGYKMLPAFQQTYRHLASLKFSKPAIDHLFKELTLNSFSSAPTTTDKTKLSIPKPPTFQNQIEFKNVSFSYPDANQDTLKNINLTIPKNSTIAFVGKSGSGKTTAADLLMGLLPYQSGHILIDEQVLTPEFFLTWRKSIGYVPQHVNLLDASLAENIAFGKAPHEIDMNAVERACHAAQLDEFIKSELSDGYQTQLGEKGLRLSGGQRQRVGIARALYSDPDLLIFDEATSALDSIHESDIMKSIESLKNKKTVVIITHRLSTVQKSDAIYFFAHGQILARGSFSELMKNHLDFKEIVTSGASHQ